MILKVEYVHDKQNGKFEATCNDFLATIPIENLIDTELIVSHYGCFTLKILYKTEK